MDTEDRLGKDRLGKDKDILSTDVDAHPRFDYQEENEMYAFSQPNVNQMTTKCQPNDNQMSAQNKINKSKVNKNKDILSTDVGARPRFDYQSVKKVVRFVRFSMVKYKLVKITTTG